MAVFRWCSEIGQAQHQADRSAGQASQKHVATSGGNGHGALLRQLWRRRPLPRPSLIWLTWQMRMKGRGPFPGRDKIREEKQWLWDRLRDGCRFSQGR